MKKVFFATTALVATAGAVSAAEIKLKGSAEMGVVGGDAYGNNTQFHTDIDVTFSMSGETDGGLAFSASVDLDESDGSGTRGSSNAFGSTTQGGETISISGGGATLTMGDTDGAFDAAMTEVIIGGSIDDATEHAGYNGNAGFDGTHDGQIARFSYAFSGVTGHLSAEIDDTGAQDPVWGLGVTYAGDLGGVNLGVGLGYQTRDSANALDSLIGLSLSTTLDNGIQARLNYSEATGSAAADQTHWGIGFGYSANALTIGVNYGQMENVGGVAGADREGFGLSVGYDLGGGAEVQFGYGQSDISGTPTTDQFSLGVAMSF